MSYDITNQEPTRGRHSRFHHDEEDRRGRHHHRGLHGLHSGRKLSSEDLQLLILSLLEKEPSHGYELIKSLEHLSNGFYVPSPGMVYPALTYLEEIGYADATTVGAKKRFAITTTGREYLEKGKDVSDRILQDLARIGTRMDDARRVFEGKLGHRRKSAEPAHEGAAYDAYTASLFAVQDSALVEAIAEMGREDIPKINVSATEGKLLQVLTLITGAKRVLEIGTLGGYSGIHFARALPEGGQLVTLEINQHHADVARRNFERAGLAHKVHVHVGPASETLQRFISESEPLFDVIFIDADKDGYSEYLRLSLPLLREGGLLLADNTLPDAVLSNEDSGTKRYNATVAQHPSLTSIVIPIFRGQGIDGLTISVKRTQAT